MSLQRPTTKFEGKGLREGRVIHEFIWQRPTGSTGSISNDGNATRTSNTGTEGDMHEQ